MITNRRDIFFNEAQHKYTDDRGNVYTSTTTVIGKYEDKFDSTEVAKACHRAGIKGNPKYRTKDNSRALTVDEILFQWETLQKKGCDRGNERHNFLEDSIKTANNYKRTGASKFINDKIYTIPHIMDDHNYGKIDLEFFIKTGISERYPIIYKLLKHYTKIGYNIYAEVGVYAYDFLISGLIDVLLVRNDEFIILDWKTNKDKIKYEAGYFAKDFEGNRTGKFTPTPNKFFNAPLDHLAASTGYKYALQLSMYAYLTELFGLKHKGMIICQILHEEYTDETIIGDQMIDLFMPDDKKELVGKERVVFYPVKYLKNEIINLTYDHTSKNVKNINNQVQLFN